MHLRNFVRPLALCVALAACESSTDARPLQGVYAVRSVEGRAMPAALDTLYWNDNVTYNVHRLMGRSVEFLGRDSARYTTSERITLYSPGQDTLFSASCKSMTLPYRTRNGQVLLIVEPALLGERGRLRIDTLTISNETLEQSVRITRGRTARLEYARGTRTSCGQ